MRGTAYSAIFAGLVAIGFDGGPVQAGSLRDQPGTLRDAGTLRNGEKLLPKITVKQLRGKRSGKLPKRRKYQPVLILREENNYFIEAPAPPAAEPAPMPEPVAAVPPDPGSPRPVALARGADAPGPGYEIGQPLPGDIPQVTLNWRAYGLPEPPAGQIYARVYGEILLLDAADRRVIGLAELAGE